MNPNLFLLNTQPSVSMQNSQVVSREDVSTVIRMSKELSNAARQSIFLAKLADSEVYMNCMWEKMSFLSEVCLQDTLMTYEGKKKSEGSSSNLPNEEKIENIQVNARFDFVEDIKNRDKIRDNSIKGRS